MTRRDMILKYIVEYFVSTAEPVGSKTLLEHYHLNCSSATIRNEMNALEVDGYLEKTHTSSGRVPSGKGYEYYVNNLRGSRVDEEVKNALQTILDKKVKSVEEVMKEACQILSNMTDCAAGVLGSNASEERLIKVQVIPLSKNSATAVFVTDQGYVENKTFIFDGNISVEEVEKMISALNDRLSGSRISEIVPKLEAMRPALTDYMVNQEMLYQILLEAFVRFSGERMELYGKDALLHQPEFASDAEKMRKLISLLDDPKAFRKAMEDGKQASDKISVRIDPEHGDVSIVSAEVDIPGAGNSSYLTVLGPKRMDYGKAVSILEYFQEALERYFNEQSNEEGGNNGKGKEK